MGCTGHLRAMLYLCVTCSGAGAHCPTGRRRDSPCVAVGVGGGARMYPPKQCYPPTTFGAKTCGDDGDDEEAEDGEHEARPALVGELQTRPAGRRPTCPAGHGPPCLDRKRSCRREGPQTTPQPAPDARVYCGRCGAAAEAKDAEPVPSACRVGHESLPAPVSRQEVERRLNCRRQPAGIHPWGVRHSGVAAANARGLVAARAAGTMQDEGTAPGCPSPLCRHLHTKATGHDFLLRGLR